MPTNGSTMPPLPLDGGCQCGKVRYLITAAPYVFYLCHCRECQRQTSSAFGESLRMHRDALEVSGTLATHTRVSDRGTRREGHFCPSCGVRIFHGTAGLDMVNVKAGTLDDTSWLRPAGHIWTASRQPFVAIPAGDLAYEGQPKDGYAALAERWQAMLAQS